MTIGIVFVARLAARGEGVPLATMTQTIGFLRFYRDGVFIPAHEFRVDLGYPLLCFRAGALPAIVDVLRNEKPLFLTWFDYSATRRFATIGTSREPVGEAEP
jgi:hypothetical protein